jgi:hypothetical protein
MKHQIIKSEHKSLGAVASCVSADQCDWVPTHIYQCVQHVRETGHTVQVKETFQTVYRLHVPQPAE